MIYAVTFGTLVIISVAGIAMAIYEAGRNMKD